MLLHNINHKALWKLSFFFNERILHLLLIVLVSILQISDALLFNKWSASLFYRSPLI